MRNKYRDVLDPNDPYWPRVRRLHVYLWANGTLAAKNGKVILVSVLWLLTSVVGTLFSIAWRGALLVGGIYLIEWIVPGMVSCVFRETIGYEMALSVLSQCAVTDVPSLPLISLAVLLVMVLLLIYPVRRFFEKAFEILFMFLNIMALGYPLKFIAFLVSREPTVAGKWFDKSHMLGPLSTAMTGIFPFETKRDLDELWAIYHQSQSPAYEKKLEELLDKFETKFAM